MSREFSPNPFVFIVGCPRSGTTLLERIVDAHPQVAIIHEMWWLLKWYKERVGMTAEGSVTPELVARLMGYRKFTKRVHLGREELEGLVRSDEPVTYARFMTGVFDLYAKARGKPLAGDKTPENVRQLETLHGLWPKARFVHLIRDGRDVCLSVRNWRKTVKVLERSPTWTEDPVTSVALWWKWHVQLGREAGSWLGPDRYYEMRYESLVAHPAEECAKLCTFFGLHYDEAMTSYHEGRIRKNPALETKDMWLPVTAGLRDWRSQMPGEETERFEAVAGDLLEELGYPRSFLRPSPQVLEQTSTIRERFTEVL
jgi:hypothetical protein